MDRIFWQRQVHSGADAEVGIRGVNALQLDCVQHILGRQVRPLEEKADSRTRRQTEKIARFLRSARGSACDQKSRENWMNFTGKRECGQSRLCSKSVNICLHRSKQREK